MERTRKVGGVVIMHPNHNNYGTALQGLATIRVIQKLGYPLRIIRYNKRRSLLDIMTTLPGYLMSGAIDVWRSQRLTKKMKKANPEYANNIIKRTEKCNEFKKRYFEPLCDYYTGWKELTEGSKNYDVVFVGSDQVWSPLSLYAGFYNLMFVDKSIPQFSYASSFGRSDVMKHQRKGVARFLEKMDAIGVRESSGAKITKKLTGRDAVVVLDPTLLLTRQEWDEQIVQSTASINEPYILSYILGPRKDNREFVMSIGEKLGLKVLSFNHMDRYVVADENFGDIQNYEADALDFLALLKNAEYVITDSFHCSVFSLLFHKQFITLYRVKPQDSKSTHSRIENLLDMAGLKDHAIAQLNKDYALKILNQEIEWKSVDEKISEFRRESLSFFSHCLELSK